MIKKILSLFRSSTAVNQTPADPQGNESAAPLARWLAKDDSNNPFSLDGFDCLGFVCSMLSTTSDPAIAKSFVSLRSADGRAVRGTLPENGMEIPCALSYRYAGETSDGALFKASVMEEKWDIFLYEGRIYFCRSWTGLLALVAEITPAENSLRISRIWAPRTADATQAVQQVDYLIKSHLYKMKTPHPLPSDLSREPDAVAMYSFGQYGRLCCFGSFEDTREKDTQR